MGFTNKFIVKEEWRNEVNYCLIHYLLFLVGVSAQEFIYLSKIMLSIRVSIKRFTW